MTLILAPLLVLLLLWLLQFSENQIFAEANLNPSSYNVEKFSPCYGNCISLMYTPVVSQTTSIMKKFALNNNMKILENVVLDGMSRFANIDF